jgi:L-amino acid N-acyltransferase YncA
MLSIRPARRADVPGMTAIYNEAVRTTTATFDTEEKTEAEQARWFEAHDSRHPILVAEKDGTVVAWSALSAWSDRCAYADTAESSIYIKEGQRGHGIGRQLKEAILQAGQHAGLHAILARVSEGNDVSLHLNEALGFRHVGVLKEVGRKFGKRLDVHLLQKIYDEDPANE